MHRKFTIACLHKKKCPALFGFQIKLKFSWLNSTSHIHINKQWNLSSELFVIPMYLLKIYIVQFGIHFFLVCVQKSLYNYDKFHGSLYIHNVNEYHGLLRFVTLKQGTAPCLLDFRCSTCMNVANSATTLLSIEADIPQSLIDCSSYNVTKLQNKNSTQITHFKL